MAADPVISRPVDRDRDRYLRAVVAAGLASTAVYLWLQLDLLGSRVFANFYDLQARALLDGHLDVPAGSLGNEAFAVRGQEFLYNPPGPSLLRIPLFLVTDRFDGRLTALSMLGAWIVSVVVLALLVWRVRRILRPGAALPVWEAAVYGTFLVVATVGSTLLYLGSVPWVFHEAYAWAVAMALGSAYGLLGVLELPSRGRIITTGLFTLGAVLSRTTAGFACAAVVILAALWLWRGARGRAGRDVAWMVALAGVGPVVIGAAVNWAKFRHPYLFPIQDQVFTSLSQHRRDAIEANGGDLFSPNLIWSTTAAYFRPDGIRFTSLFPFISLPAEPAPTYGSAVFDLTYRTGSVVSFMPGLVGVAAWGLVTAVRPRGPRAAALLRLPLLGALLIPAGVLFGAYISHRYTAEFLPLLLVAGAVGLVDLARRLGGRRGNARRGVLAGLGLVAAFGVAANLAVAVSTQALASPGPVLAAHVGRQAGLSGLLGGDLDDHVVASVQLPLDAPADEVRILGDCQAMYVSTGEEYTPWSEIGTREVRYGFTLVDASGPEASGSLPLAEIVGHRRTTLALEHDGAGRYRLVLDGGGRDAEADWFEPAPGSPFEVEVTTDRFDEYVISAFGRRAFRVPKENHDEDWYWMPNLLTPTPPSPSAAAVQRLSVVTVPADPPAGCEPLLERYREAAAP